MPFLFFLLFLRTTTYEESRARSVTCRTKCKSVDKKKESHHRHCQRGNEACRISVLGFLTTMSAPSQYGVKQQQQVSRKTRAAERDAAPKEQDARSGPQSASAAFASTLPSGGASEWSDETRDEAHVASNVRHRAEPDVPHSQIRRLESRIDAMEERLQRSIADLAEQMRGGSTAGPSHRHSPSEQKSLSRLVALAHRAAPETLDEALRVDEEDDADDADDNPSQEEDDVPPDAIEEVGTEVAVVAHAGLQSAAADVGRLEDDEDDERSHHDGVRTDEPPSAAPEESPPRSKERGAAPTVPVPKFGFMAELKRTLNAASEARL